MKHIDEIEWPEEMPRYRTTGNGDPAVTYTEFMNICNQLCVDLVGLGIYDLADAEWYTYYDEGMEPREALAYALYDYNDMSLELLEEIGLGDLV